MMKKLIAAVSVILLACTLTLPAFAMTMAPSSELGATVASATLTDSNGASRPIETVVEGVTIEEEAAPLGGGIVVEQVETATRPYIKVTPVEQTMAANDKYDEENGDSKPFSERLGDPTESGLRYGKNNDTNLVYLTAQKSDSTTEFLGKFPEGLVSTAEEQIETLRQEQLARLAEQRAALAAELEALTNEAEKTAKQAELDALDARTASWESGEAGKLDDYAAIGLFDITASAGAIEEMGENGKVDVEIEIAGITEESSLLAVHFFGELADPEAVRTALEEDFANALVDFDYELLPVVPSTFLR